MREPGASDEPVDRSIDNLSQSARHKAAEIHIVASR